jgi:hypothetical protein
MKILPIIVRKHVAFSYSLEGDDSQTLRNSLRRILVQHGLVQSGVMFFTGELPSSDLQGLIELFLAKAQEGPEGVKLTNLEVWFAGVERFRLDPSDDEEEAA